MAFNTRIQTRRDTASNWETKNPVLLEGEMIIVTTNAGDTRFKIGDGQKTYTQLPFQDETLYNVLSGKAESAHTHNDIYYTETEMDEALAQKSKVQFVSQDGTESVPVLTVHKLTQEEYDSMVSAGTLDEATLYLTPDEETDMSQYATVDQLEAKADTNHGHDVDDVNGLQSALNAISEELSNHNHDSEYDDKGSAAAVQGNLDTVSNTLNTHTENSDIHVTTANKTNWDAAYTHSTATHARTDATKAAKSSKNGNILINGTETKVYTHPSSGVTAGTYTSVTVDAEGHVTGGSNPTTLAGYGITDAESKGAATAALETAKEYADNAANAVKNELLNGAGTAYDTLKELGDLIDDNVDAIEALETVAAGKADKIHEHAISDITNLQSALDGKADASHGTHVSFSTTKPVMDGTASVGSKTTVARSDHRHPTDTSRAAKTDLDSHTGDATVHITATERTTWNAMEANANSYTDTAVAQKTSVQIVTWGSDD